MDNITEESIENACDNLRLAILDLLENGPNDEDASRADGALLAIMRTINTLLERER